MKQNLNILQIAPFYEPHLGGVETHLQELNQELLKRGHRVSVLTLQFDANLSQQEEKNGVKIIRIDPTTKYFSQLNYKIELWRQLAKNSHLLLKADIIQVHDVYWWLIPLLPLFWYKIYLTFHGWEGIYPVPWKSKLARWIWSKLAVKTLHVGKYIQEFYWDKPDEVIYGGIGNLPKIIQKKNSKKKTTQKLKIVFVGRLEKENEINLYLQLIKLLKKDFPIEVIWVGDGSYKKACQRLGQVMGMVKNPALHLIEADLVFAASYLSILEAQALGKISCAFYSQPLKKRYLETFPSAKLMLIAQSAAEMRTKIKLLLEAPDLKKRFETQAAAWAQTQTWSRVTDVYQKIWRIA